MAAKTDGDCFQANAETVLALATEINPAILEIVHGLVTNPETGQRHIHCWAEVNREMAVDRSNGHSVTIQRNLYYLIGEIDEEELIRYSVLEMRRQLAETGVWGPWEQWLYDLETIPTHNGETP